MLHVRVHRSWLLATGIVLSGCGTTHVPEPAATVTDTTAIASALDQSAITRAYGERLRLGMGSPYRLVELVLRDERLGRTRSFLASALLDSIQHGHFAEISPLVLVDAGVAPTSAIAQLELIQQTIERTQDPRSAEAAVDLAYQQLVTDSVIPERVSARIIRVAALLRDRQLAMADARRLAHEAGKLGIAPRDLVLSWRRDRRFAVEQPTVLPLTANARADAERLALLLRGGVLATLQPAVSELNRTIPPTQSLVSQPDATLLLAADSAQRSAQGALVITMRALQRGAAGTPTRLADARWQQLFARAQDEERFVAGLALAQQDSLDQQVAAGVALEVASALRPFAQERLAVIDTITPAMLRDRFGVRLRFGARLSPASRSALLTDLQYALLDMQRVLPGLRLDGLTFDVRAIPENARYQAYHDPQHRVIRIDPAAAAGTLAHELGHDLDWQLARRKYDARGTYATDYAVRRRKSLAYLVSNLQTDERPAEVFARRFEWFVTEALAAQGRSNGFLSSVQNEWLGGYGSAVRPEREPIASRSFVSILAQATDMEREAEQAAVLLVGGYPTSIDELLATGTARQDRMLFPTTQTSAFTRLQP